MRNFEKKALNEPKTGLTPHKLTLSLLDYGLMAIQFQRAGLVSGLSLSVLVTLVLIGSLGTATPSRILSIQYDSNRTRYEMLLNRLKRLLSLGLVERVKAGGNVTYYSLSSDGFALLSGTLTIPQEVEDFKALVKTKIDSTLTRRIRAHRLPK